MTSWLFNHHFQFTNGYNPMKAGVEVKYACEAAEDTGAKLVFMDNEFNRETR